MTKIRQFYFKVARSLAFIGMLAVPMFSAQISAAEQKSEERGDCQLISSQSAVKKAQKKTGGKVVSIKLNKAGKDSVYKVRVLVDEKRIKNISIKACK